MEKAKESGKGHEVAKENTKSAHQGTSTIKQNKIKQI